MNAPPDFNRGVKKTLRAGDMVTLVEDLVLFAPASSRQGDIAVFEAVPNAPGIQVTEDLSPIRIPSGSTIIVIPPQAAYRVQGTLSHRLRALIGRVRNDSSAGVIPVALFAVLCIGFCFTVAAAFDHWPSKSQAGLQKSTLQAPLKNS